MLSRTGQDDTAASTQPTAARTTQPAPTVTTPTVTSPTVTSATSQSSTPQPSGSSPSAAASGSVTPTPSPQQPIAASAATWVFAQVGARGPGTAALTAGPASIRKNTVHSSASRCPVARGDLLVPFVIRLHNTGAHAQTFALKVTALGHRPDGTTLLAQVSSGGTAHCYGRSSRDASFTVAAGQLPPSAQRRATGFFLLIHAARAEANPPLVTVTVPERVSALGARIRCVLSGGPGAVRLPHRAALRLPTGTG